MYSSWLHRSLVVAEGNQPSVHTFNRSEQLTQWLVSDSEDLAISNLKQPNQSDTVRYVVLDSMTMGSELFSLLLDAGVSLEGLTGVDGELRLGRKRLPRWRLNPIWKKWIAYRLYFKDAADLHRFRLVYESPHESYLANLKFEQGGLMRTSFTIDSKPQRQQISEWLASDEPVRSVMSGAYEYDGEILPTVKIFELVRGATIRGTSSPGAVVTARLKLTSKSTGREIEYAPTVLANEEGTFELRVSHASGVGPTNWIASESAYRLESSESKHLPTYVRVSESTSRMTQ